MPVQLDPNTSTYYPVTSNGDVQALQGNAPPEDLPPESAQSSPPEEAPPPPPPSEYVGSVVDTVV